MRIIYRFLALAVGVVISTSNTLSADAQVSQGLAPMDSALSERSERVPQSASSSTDASARPFKGHRFMGVASCSSSNCHGAVAPRDATNVLQNEYTTWSKHDAHSKAYLTLLNEDSRTIAAHLGIDRAETEPLCLACHATYRMGDTSTHGEKFRLEDGVSCEACHGGAERYLSSHTEEGATHARNIEHGLTDMVNPEARASLCLSCHLGNEEKYVDHALIGAGHPRLTFELDTFTALQPVHWDVDEDYKERKEDYIPAQAWVIGQAARALATLDIMSSTTRSRAGSGLLAGPELTLLYCYTCHHSLTEDQWQRRNYGDKVGELRLNTSSFEIAAHALTALDKSTGQSILRLVGALHDSQNPAAQLTELRSLLNSSIKALSSASFSREQLNRLIIGLAKVGAASAESKIYPPFEVAEQLAMGISAAASTIKADGSFFKREIDQIYSSLSDPESFQPELFASACQQLVAALS